MDANTLAIAIRIAELLGPAEPATPDGDGAERDVIVRTDSAGAWFGTLIGKSSNEVVLANAIRLWYWDGAFTLSALAMSGPGRPQNCKFAVSVPEVTLSRWCEIIPATATAASAIRGVDPHRP
jgi:hypothetical protein